MGVNFTACGCLFAWAGRAGSNRHKIVAASTDHTAKHTEEASNFFNLDHQNHVLLHPY